VDKKDIIVIGASAGGIDALKTIVSDLPAELPATILITLHTAPYSLGILPEILERSGNLPASNATDLEQIQRGRIYVAPPDFHLLLEAPGFLRVTKGPKENRFRPAVDPLFRSAAHAFGPRVIGVVLTGWLDDGTAGLWAVKERGGTAVVQHPEDSFASGMPLNAVKHVEVDHITPLREIAPLLVRLAGEPVRKEGEIPMSDQMETEVKIAKEENALESGILRWGEPSIYTCPECHGVLLQKDEGSNLRFRCHTGHAYSVDSLLSEITEKSEESLWNAVRAVEEGILLMRELARHFEEQHNRQEAKLLSAKAHQAQLKAEVMRNLILKAS
jgi:two-component system chemotaxis response regulator CheB